MKRFPELRVRRSTAQRGFETGTGRGRDTSCPLP